MSNIKNLTSAYSEAEKTEQIKHVCLGLLDKFKDVCTKYNLTWWVDSGTLLGTLRDGKMIPWDDDIDVVMPREDYDELCNLVQLDTKMFGRYFFQTSVTDTCFEVHAKLRDANTCALTPREYSGKHNRGMFLDIYPLDCAPKSKDVRNDIAGFVRTIAKHTGQERKFEKSARFYALNAALRDIGIKYKKDGMFAKMVYWRYDKKLIAIDAKAYDISKTIEMPFENLMVPVPADANQVLTALYGEDWRIPKHEENGHHAFVDPFHRYKLYDGCTQKDFENLTK